MYGTSLDHSWCRRRHRRHLSCRGVSCALAVTVIMFERHRQSGKVTDPSPRPALRAPEYLHASVSLTSDASRLRFMSVVGSFSRGEEVWRV